MFEKVQEVFGHELSRSGTEPLTFHPASII